MLEDWLGGQLSGMAVVRAVARPMLASIFIVQGLNTMRNPERVVKKAEPVVRPIAERVSFIPDDTEQAVRLNGAVQMTAGILLAVGWVPRLAALTIAATLVPTTAAGHRFWEEPDPVARSNQRTHFFKNISMLGGLLLGAVDTEGKPGLAWRAKHAADDARRETKHLRKAARREAKLAAKSVKR
jgi:uncharacterized membrane protein YphA (DoxX/SURF4 family)